MSKQHSHLQVARNFHILACALGCAALGGCSLSPAAVDAQARAFERHQERIETQLVARGVFENPRTIAGYCGAPAPSETGTSAFAPNCYRRLHAIFFARLEVAYPLANWAEVALVCDAYPNRCDSARELEAVVCKTQADASVVQLERDKARIAAQESSRSSRKSKKSAPEPSVTLAPALAMADTRAVHESKAPFIQKLQASLWKAESGDDVCVALDETRDRITLQCPIAVAPSETALATPRAFSAPRSSH